MWDAVQHGPLGCVLWIVLPLLGLLVLVSPYLLVAVGAAGLVVAGARYARHRLRRDAGTDGNGSADQPLPPATPWTSATPPALRRGMRRWGIALLAGALLLLPPFATPVRNVSRKLVDAGLCGSAHPLASTRSPAGGRAARAELWLCGGAAGSVHSEVVVRPGWDRLGLYERRVATLRRRPEAVRLVWASEDRLAVEYRGELLEPATRTWGTLRIEYVGLGA